MIDNMEQFLELLESRGDLVRVSRPVEDGHEIFSVLWRLTELGGGPAVVFENVPPHDIPVVSNLFGTLDRFALACGFPPGLTIDASLLLEEGQDYTSRIIIDATTPFEWPKDNQPRLITLTPEVERRVRERWKEYFPD
jgi:UbiD family decarboxylase